MKKAGDPCGNLAFFFCPPWDQALYGAVQFHNPGARHDVGDSRQETRPSPASMMVRAANFEAERQRVPRCLPYVGQFYVQL